jgi:hypothetical protein
LIQEQGWSASKVDVLAYHLLEWSADPSNGGRSLDDAWRVLGADPDTLYGILREFWESGLAKDTDRANVPTMNSVFLTGTGSAAAREIAAASRNVGKRRVGIRNAIVDWLNSVGEPAELSDFLGDPRGSFFGVSYTQNEMDAAEEYLLDKDIITGIKTSGGLVRPKLTSYGLDCADGHSSDVQAYLNRSQALTGSTHVTVMGSTGVNVAANSTNVTQSMAVAQETINEIQKIVESFQQSRNLLGLDGENDSRLTVLSGEILEEIARPSPDKNKLKGFLESLHSIGVSGAGSALGSVLGQAALTLMGSF